MTDEAAEQAQPGSNEEEGVTEAKPSEPLSDEQVINGVKAALNRQAGRGGPRHFVRGTITTPGGRLFDVMAVIEGDPIQAYRDAKAAGADATLDFFVRSGHEPFVDLNERPLS